MDLTGTPGPLVPFAIAFYFAVLASPLWLPVAFAAYAIGRKRFELRALFVFVTIEAGCLSIWTAVIANGTVTRSEILNHLGTLVGLGAPIWILIVGVTFNLARGRVSPLSVFIFVALELASIALGWVLLVSLFDD